MKKLLDLIKVDDTTEDRQYRLGYNHGIGLQFQSDKQAVEKCREKIAKILYILETLPVPWDMLSDDTREEWAKDADQIISILLQEEE